VKRFILVFIAFSLIAIFSTPASAEMYGVVNLTDNTTTDTQLSVSNGQMAWRSHASDQVTYFWDGIQTTPISDPNMLTDGLHLNNGEVVYRGFDGNDYEIFYWDGNSTQQLSNNDVNDSDPNVYNGTVSWRKGSSPTQTIQYWNGATAEQISFGFNDADPILHEDGFFYSGNSSVGYHLYHQYWDESTPTQLSVGNLASNDISYHYNAAAWREDNRLLYFDGDSIHEIATHNNDMKPSLYDGQIAFEDEDNSIVCLKDYID